MWLPRMRGSRLNRKLGDRPILPENHVARDVLVVLSRRYLFSTLRRLEGHFCRATPNAIAGSGGGDVR